MQANTLYIKHLLPPLFLRVKVIASSHHSLITALLHGALRRCGRAWSIICQIGYWDKLGCAQYDSLPLALTVADYGFNSGVKRAATALQLVLNELNEMLAWKMGKPLVIDGVVGPKTIAQVQMITKPMQAFVCARLHDVRAEFIKEAVRKGNIHVKFLTGLMNRIRRTTAYALQYI